MAHLTQVVTSTANATERLAAQIAELALPGDVLTLSGGLGAGKTTFARGFIQALMKAPVEVPSPTFTLVQTYDTTKGPVWHCDLYRLNKPQDSLELGLEEAFGNAICLIEWPERLDGLLPASRLAMSIALDGTARRISMDGNGQWRERLNNRLKV
ncbi:MAG: tRNA (adenosine(37)-N6)-threonylcarbamoyltransferase complex ATPase subunit type 1 TsaE [Rhodospirillaceae bacterium]|nr:tRNA (adenosine(37)-N6)-threonylcarbamoyltransferase complex ATPase subunit type 1 TsaE [Rhodospirillaceae bacterium]